MINYSNSFIPFVLPTRPLHPENPHCPSQPCPQKSKSYLGWDAGIESDACVAAELDEILKVYRIRPPFVFDVILPSEYALWQHGELGVRVDHWGWTTPVEFEHLQFR